MSRKIATSAKPKVFLIKNKNGTFSFKSKAGLMGTTIDITPGVEFEERTMNEGSCRSNITFKGNRMTHIQRGDKEVKIVRELDDERLMLTMYVDDFVVRRFFKTQLIDKFISKCL